VIILTSFVGITRYCGQDDLRPSHDLRSKVGSRRIQMNCNITFFICFHSVATCVYLVGCTHVRSCEWTSCDDPDFNVLPTNLHFSSNFEIVCINRKLPRFNLFEGVLHSRRIKCLENIMFTRIIFCTIEFEAFWWSLISLLNLSLVKFAMVEDFNWKLEL
jgi:hypothetical protein